MGTWPTRVPPTTLSDLDAGRSPANRSPVTSIDPPEVRARFDSGLSLVDAIVRQVCAEVGDVLPGNELVSFGREGLLEAARRYDPDRGVPFLRFAQYRVRGAVLDGMRRHAQLPRRAHEKVKALRAATSAAEGMVEDTTAAVAAGLRGEAADQRLADQLAIFATAMAVGFGAALALDDDGTTIAVDESRSPEEQMQSAELMRVVHEEIDRLPEIEAVLVRRHILGEESLDTAAASMGLSKSWASRLVTRAMATLTRRLKRAI